MRYTIDLLFDNIKGIDFLTWRFYVLLLCVGGPFWIIPTKYRKGLLLIVSLLFYLLNGKRTFVLLIYLVVSSWVAAVLIEKGKTPKRALCLGVMAVAAPFVLNRIFLTGVAIFSSMASLLSCMGLAYTTMMAIGYMVDVYKRRYPHLHFFNYATFLAFFPYAVSGPIERADHMNGQIEALETETFSWRRIQAGTISVIYGLFVKLVLADRIAILVNEVLGHYQKYIGLELLLAVFLYGVEIYCDFSACSNIAVGIARCFGIEIMNNFAQPYFSRNISDFWRKWHRSLSFWLRDYVYIPLGGNRLGKFRQYVNLCITFVVSGLWHGFSFHFVLWGMLHGIYQVIEKATLSVRQNLNRVCNVNPDTMGHQLLQGVLTFVAVDFAWIFFKVEKVDDAIQIIRRMVCGIDFTFVYGDYLQLGLGQLDWRIMIIGLFIVIVVDILHNRYKEQFMDLFLNENLCMRYIIFLSLFAATVVFGIYGAGYDRETFIYRGF